MSDLASPLLVVNEGDEVRRASKLMHANGQLAC